MPVFNPYNPMSDINYWSTRLPFDGNDDDQNMNRIIDLKRVTVLGDYPVTVADAKEKCRVTFSDDDGEFTKLISRVIRWVENYCNISIVYQRLQLTAYMVREWKLPYGPVIGIESVADNAGQTGSGPVSYTESTANWQVDGDLYNPGGGYRQRITYTAGMENCPDDLKEVILEVISFLYENRGADEKTEAVQDLLTNADNYKVMLWI